MAFAVPLAVTPSDPDSGWARTDLPYFLLALAALCFVGIVAVFFDIPGRWRKQCSVSFALEGQKLEVRIAPLRFTLTDTTLNLLVPESVSQLQRVDADRKLRAQPADEPLTEGSDEKSLLWGESHMHFSKRVVKRLPFQFVARPGSYRVKLRLVSEVLPRGRDDHWATVDVPITERDVRNENTRLARQISALTHMRNELLWNRQVLRTALVNGHFWTGESDSVLMLRDDSWKSASRDTKRIGLSPALLDSIRPTYKRISYIQGHIWFDGPCSGRRLRSDDAIEELLVNCIHAGILIERALREVHSLPRLEVGEVPTKERAKSP